MQTSSSTTATEIAPEDHQPPRSDGPPEPSAATPRPPGDATDASARLEQVVTRGVERILHALDDKQALDRFRESQIDRLHAELQGYRNDLVGKAVRPVLQSLIRLHDNLGKVLEALAAESPPEQLDPVRLLELLASFRDDVEIALDQNGVTVFRTEGDQFDAKRQRVVRTIETTEPGEVGRVNARVRPGFEQGEHIIEKERVAVYALAPVKSA